MRSNAARMSHGRSMPLPISMIWPVPARVRPAPPESGRNSFFQKISGVWLSAISTGVPRTPLG